MYSSKSKAYTNVCGLQTIIWKLSVISNIDEYFAGIMYGLNSVFGVI